MPEETAVHAGHAGHAGHVKPSRRTRGLEGSMSRPVVITFLGAGSMFCPELCRDVLEIPGNDAGEFRLVDIDGERVEVMRQVELLIDELDRPGWSVIATTDRREVLAGTHYTICCVEVSGLECVGYDNDIPKRYGVDQCIGDDGTGGTVQGPSHDSGVPRDPGRHRRALSRSSHAQLHRPDGHDVLGRVESSAVGPCRRALPLGAGPPRRSSPYASASPTLRSTGTAQASTISPGSPACDSTESTSTHGSSRKPRPSSTGDPTPLTTPGPTTSAPTSCART